MSNKRMGRPPKGEAVMMTPIAVRFPPAMRQQLERIKDERLDSPELSAIIRELVAEALQARSRKK